MRGLQPDRRRARPRKSEVIIEERRQRIENNPEAMLEEQLSNAALYRNHPYHWPVIGWMNEMEGLTKDDILKSPPDLVSSRTTPS